MPSPPSSFAALDHLTADFVLADVVDVVDLASEDWSPRAIGRIPRISTVTNSISNTSLPVPKVSAVAVQCNADKQMVKATVPSGMLFVFKGDTPSFVLSLISLLVEFTLSCLRTYERSCFS